MLAVLFSLLLHLGAWGGYELGKNSGWWNALRALMKSHSAAQKIAAEQFVPVDPQIFVNVAQPDAAPPKKVKYYSNANAHAAQRDEPDKNLNQPKLNGAQTEVAKTETAKQFSQLQPSAPPKSQAQPSVEQNSQTPSPDNLGDVKLTKAPSQNPAEQNSPPPRPRTLKEAMAQQHIPGLEMQQNGGAHRRLVADFDVKKSPFGDYDAALINAVTQHWYDLLDSQRFALDRTGKVVLRFKLKYDGTVENMAVLDSTVGELLSYVCQEAISESAPFGKWPDDMRRTVGENYREITFTFYYY